MHIQRWLFQTVLVSVGLTVFGGWSSGFAAVATVQIQDNQFSPASTNINVNDQVIWNWTGFNSHSTTSSQGLWDSHLHGNGFAFTNTFANAGSFPYFCALHTFMTASITVVGTTHVPPSVALTNPVNGAVFSAPASFTLRATAAASNGNVTNVQFLQETTSLTNVKTSPYSVVVSNLAAGSYNFAAVASDDAGLKATNAITVTVVTPVQIVLSAPHRLSATSFQFDYTANTGLSYVVLRSGNVSSFTPINTNRAGNSAVTFTDNNASASFNAYRVQRQPNP